MTDRPYRPQTKAESVHACVARHSLVERRRCEDPERRARLEQDDAAWLAWYGNRTFTRPFDEAHMQSLEMMRWVAETSRSAAIAGERGFGKSAPLVWMVLKFALTREFRFPVYVPWAASHSSNAMRAWQIALTQNERLFADYPEIVAPFVHAGGVTQRMVALRWADDETPCGASLNMGNGIIVFPDGLGAIGTKSINGQPRGMFYPSKDGGWIRPDFAAVDDVQDRKVAKSDALVADVCQRIDSDVSGMGEAGSPLPMFLTGNCITDRCVMTQYLNDPRFRSLRISCVKSWPDAWGEDSKPGPARQLWKEWWDAFDAGRHDEARAFYEANRAAMSGGFSLSSPHAYGDPVKIAKVGVSDCFTLAMFQYFKMGHESFMAERQQRPISPLDSAELTVTPAQIRARAVGPQKGTQPENTVRLIAGADINPGLTTRLGPRVTWVLGAFDLHRACTAMMYGLWPVKMPDNPTIGQQVSAVYAALNELRVFLSRFGEGTLVYDARGWYNNGVTRGQAIGYSKIALAGSTFSALPAEGWPNEGYRPTHKTAIRQFEGCHLARDRIEQHNLEWLAWNADYFNLAVLRGWLASPGAPGSCVLYSGEHDDEFLRQVSRRAYAGTVQKHSGLVYDWIRQPGEDDFGDALAMCYAGAAYHGIGSGAGSMKPKRSVRAIVMRPSQRR